MQIQTKIAGRAEASSGVASKAHADSQPAPPSPRVRPSSRALPLGCPPVLRTASPPHIGSPLTVLPSASVMQQGAPPAEPAVFHTEPALFAVPRPNSLVPQEYCTTATTSSDRTLALWIASAEDDTGLMKALLKGDVEIDRMAPPGMTLLHLGCMSAALSGDPDEDSSAVPGQIASADRRQMVEAAQIHILCEAGASPDLRDHLGRTPLHIACASGTRLLARVLLNNCADPNLPDWSQCTPLHLACLNGNPQTIALLLAFGADPNLPDDAGRTPISIARDKNLSSVCDLLSVSSRLVPPKRGPGSFFPPLHAAVMKNDCHKVLKMLKRGADPEARDGNDRTPLLRACAQGHMEIAEILIANGANVNAGLCDNMTVLHFAVMLKNFELVTMLLRKGANLYARNCEGVTPLDIAAQCAPSMLKYIANLMPSARIAKDQKK